MNSINPRSTEIALHDNDELNISQRDDIRVT